MEGLRAVSSPKHSNGHWLNRYLVLDGLQLEPLERWLYEQVESPAYEPLYLGTPLEGCRGISPCLVQLQDNDPLWKRFLESGVEGKWGWGFASSAKFDELLKHLRWLLFVEHPLEGEKILRVASADVMRLLLSAEMSPQQSDLLGNMETAWFPMNKHGEVSWYEVANERTERSQREVSFQLQQAHLEALSHIAWERFAEELSTHLDTFFASGVFLRAHGGPRLAAERVIHLTKELGFTGRRAHYYMANILGAHGEQALDEHAMPDMAALLQRPDQRAPMERLKAAAEASSRLMNTEKQV